MEDIKLKFAKVRNVKTPVRGTPLSAGIDFFVPEFDIKFQNDIQAKNAGQLWMNHEEHGLVMIIQPQGRLLIPSGIHIDLETLATQSIYTGLAFIAHNKSGVASKQGLDVLACVVDEDYQGEIHINVVNTGNKDVYIKAGDKLIQFLLIPVAYPGLEECKFEELYEKETSRGAGGFGSTDTQESMKGYKDENLPFLNNRELRGFHGISGNIDLS